MVPWESSYPAQMRPQIPSPSLGENKNKTVKFPKQNMFAAVARDGRRLSESYAFLV